ncbi:MAG TPA: DUF4126 domain-containing protein [Holophagaceae bacterium]|nr:DUF4126 domain-containing protein [Holophagaceae bacterium]
MGAIQNLAGILGLSFVSGINLYLGVLVTGLAQRLGLVSGLPPELQVLGHTWVLVAAGILYLVEFFADKIPFITPVWDFLHTFIRPVGGALLALGAAGRLSPEAQVLATLMGGGIALAAHGTKMGVRLAAHAVPDPGTHAAISVAEDTGVVALLALAWRHPALAVAVLLALLAVMAAMVPRLVRTLRFLLAAVSGRVKSWFGRGRITELPLPIQEAVHALDPEGEGLVMKAFALQMKGAPALARGALVKVRGEWHFIFKGWFRMKTLPVLAVVRQADLKEGTRHEPGLVFDDLVFKTMPRFSHFYLTKDWASFLNTGGSGIR